MDFQPEPLPDAKEVKKRGRPKKSNDDAAKERENDVQKLSLFSVGYVAIDWTNSIEYDGPNGQVVVLEGNDLELMTTKLACEHGVFIPEGTH